MNFLKKSKKIFIAMTMFVVMMCLSGCGVQKYSLQINDDDTCNFALSVSINKDTYNLLPTYGIDVDKLNREKNTSTGTAIDDVDAIFQETAVMFQQYGYNIEVINDSIDLGFKANKTYQSIEEFNSEIKSFYNNGLIGTNLEITKNQTRYDTQYTCYGELNYVLDSDIDFNNETVSDAFNSFFDTSQLTCQLEVVMPYSTTVTATDGSSVNGILTWTNSYDEGSTEEVHVISEYKNTKAYIITGIIVFVAVVVVVIVGFKVFKKIKSKRNEQSYSMYDDE